jgi:hypothetical protein
VRNLVLRFGCIVGACPTTVRSQDVGTHPRGEALEVRGNLVMEEEVPGLVLEMQSRRNTEALCGCCMGVGEWPMTRVLCRE